MTQKNIKLKDDMLCNLQNLINNIEHFSIKYPEDTFQDLMKLHFFDLLDAFRLTFSDDEVSQNIILAEKRLMED